RARAARPSVSIVGAASGGPTGALAALERRRGRGWRRADPAFTAEAGGRPAHLSKTARPLERPWLRGADPSFKAQRGCRPAHLSKTARPLERRSSWKDRVQAVCDSSLPKSGPFSPVVKTTAMPNEPSATQPKRIHPAAGLAASARKTEMTTATTSRPSKTIGYFRKRFSPLRTP